MINIITVSITLVCLIFVLFLLVMGKKTYGDAYSKLDKKEFPFKDLMYIGAYLGYNILKEKHIKLSHNQVEKARHIYRQMSAPSEVENKVRLFYIQKLTILAVMIGLASFIGMLTGVQGLLNGNGNQEPIEITETERPDYFEGDKKISYKVKVENNSPTDVENKETDTKVTVIIPRKQPSKEELKKALELAKENIETYALGKNESWDQITTSLNFYTYDERAGIQIEWGVEDGSMFYSDGQMRGLLYSDQGKDEVVKIAFYYNEEKLDQITKKLHIVPVNYTDDQLRERAIVEAQENINAQKKYVEKNKVLLPVEDQDKKVQMKWYEYIEGSENGHQESALIYFMLFSMLGIIAYFAYDQELKKILNERKTNIENEFPIFIDKFVLLLNCGSSMFSALNQSIRSAIINDPEKENHPLYKELMFVQQEIEQGISDVDAIENFGRRVRIPNIMKFSSLISQAIRKGDKEITESLGGLVKEAWEKKKQIAKERGAQASSKMMLPLAIMLVAIVIMIMAPAIFQLQF